MFFYRISISVPVDLSKLQMDNFTIYQTVIWKDKLLPKGMLSSGGIVYCSSPVV